MSKIIFEQKTTFTGRNGQFIATGISIKAGKIMADQLKTVSIMPLTSKGQLGRCEIRVPIESLKRMIKELEGLLPPAEKYYGGNWTTPDVISKGKELGYKITEEKAVEIWECIERQHDASIGINWDTIEYFVHEVFGEELPKLPTAQEFAESIKIFISLNNDWLRIETMEKATVYSTEDCGFKANDELWFGWEDDDGSWDLNVFQDEDTPEKWHANIYKMENGTRSLEDVYVAVEIE
jgi:hypothetical protein